MQSLSPQADTEQLKQDARASLARATALFNLQHTRDVDRDLTTTTNFNPHYFLQKFNQLTQKVKDVTQPRYPDPLLSFPPEIWQDCLLRASAEVMGGLLTFIQVNTHWASEITQCPVLWRDIYIDSSEIAVEVLLIYSQLASNLSTNITLSWPLSQYLKDNLSNPLSKCYQLNLRLQEGVFKYQSHHLHDFLRSYDLPLLEHLTFSSNFDAKASDAIYLLRAPRLRLVEGISTNVSPKVHGYTKRLSGFPAPSCWRFRGSTAYPAEHASNCPVINLIRTSSKVSDFRPELTFLQVPLNCDLSWLECSFPALKELRTTIRNRQLVPVINLIARSPLLEILKLVLYTKGEIPEDICATDLPGSFKIEYMHLEATLEDNSTLTVPKTQMQGLSAWLVRLLASFLQFRPPLRELNFRAIDAPLNQQSSEVLLNLLDNNSTLSHWIMPTELSLDGLNNDNPTCLPNLRKLTLLEADLLSVLKAPMLSDLEFISRPNIEAGVHIPSCLDLASNLPQIQKIQYNISRRVGRLVNLYNFIRVIDFTKHTPDQEIWPSKRVDDFCKLLLDDLVCPMIHTIGSDICPGWDLLFRVLSRRNVFSQLETSHLKCQSEAIRCIRLSITPHPIILSPLVRLLGGFLPTSLIHSVISVESYVDMDSPGCFNCIAAGLLCDSLPSRKESGPITLPPVCISLKGWERFLLRDTNWLSMWEEEEARRSHMMRMVNRQQVCSRYRSHGKWNTSVYINASTPVVISSSLYE